MLIWSTNINNNQYLSLHALDENGIPCCEIESEWAETKTGCIIKLIRDCWWRKNMRYILGISKIRNKNLNTKEKAILKSYNYATGTPFQ